MSERLLHHRVGIRNSRCRWTFLTSLVLDFLAGGDSSSRAAVSDDGPLLAAFVFLGALVFFAGTVDPSSEVAVSAAAFLPLLLASFGGGFTASLSSSFAPPRCLGAFVLAKDFLSHQDIPVVLLAHASNKKHCLSCLHAQP